MKTKSTALLAAGSVLVHQTLAADRQFTWNLTYGVLPGTANKDVILINKQWPPAAIEVEVGDKIILTVNNDKLNGVKDGVSVHAHGFHQKNNNQNDGPIGVTQCAIPQGGSQTYTWHADQPGTFWIHSHKVAQYPLGLRSPLIVRDPSEASYYGYDANLDFVMDMSDNWSDSMSAVEAKFRSAACCAKILGVTGCGLEVPPTSALVHDNLSGVQKYNVSNAGSNKMRVRLINMSATSQFIVFSDDEDMDLEVIEVDGVPLKNSNIAVAKSLEIHPGQRYSVLVKNDKNFLMHAVVDPAQFSGNSCLDMKTYTGANSKRQYGGGRGGNRGSNDGSILYNYALMAYAQFDLGKGDMPAPYFAANAYCTDTSKPCYTRSGTNQVQSIVNLPSHASDMRQRLDESWETSGKLVTKVYQERILYGDDSDSIILTLALTADHDETGIFASLNSKDFMEPTVPVLLRQTQQGGRCLANNFNLGPADQYYGANNTFNVKSGMNVFLVVSSAPGQHPFHLHGHDFQVLYQSQFGHEFSVDMEAQIKSNSLPMLDAPLRRDTSWIGQKSYSIFAVKTDNPGAWFMHCHNDFHSMMGMAATLVVESPDSDSWNGENVGQAVWDQCKFESAKNGSFSDWACSNGLNVQVPAGFEARR